MFQAIEFEYNINLKHMEYHWLNGRLQSPVVIDFCHLELEYAGNVLLHVTALLEIMYICWKPLG